MANQDRARRDRQAYASDVNLKLAASGDPANSAKRLLKRMAAETVEEAIARAQLMPWWLAVMDPMPRGDVRFWVWFCHADQVETIREEVS